MAKTEKPAASKAAETTKSSEKPAGAGKRRKTARKNIVSGIAHVNASFNNTIVTMADAQGNTIAWSSSGLMRLQGFA